MPTDGREERERPVRATVEGKGGVSSDSFPVGQPAFGCSLIFRFFFFFSFFFVHMFFFPFARYRKGARSATSRLWLESLFSLVLFARNPTADFSLLLASHRRHCTRVFPLGLVDIWSFSSILDWPSFKRELGRRVFPRRTTSSGRCRLYMVRTLGLVLTDDVILFSPLSRSI